MSDEENTNAVELKKPSLREDLRDVYKAADKLTQNATDQLIGPGATKTLNGAKSILRKIKGKILTRSKVED